MEKDALVQRLMATFVGELEDHVRTLEHDLLALEKKPSPEAREKLFSTLFRTSHSLKGAARSVRVLADTLERHPEALLRGKSQDAAK